MHFLIFFLFKNSFLTKNYFHTAEINLTTRGPLYTCLVSTVFNLENVKYHISKVDRKSVESGKLFLRTEDCKEV